MTIKKKCRICRNEAQNFLPTYENCPSFHICVTCKRGLKSLIEETLFSKGNYAYEIRRMRRQIEKMESMLFQIQTQLNEKQKNI